MMCSMVNSCLAIMFQMLINHHKLIDDSINFRLQLCNLSLLYCELF